MAAYHKRSKGRFLCLLACLLALGTAGFLAGWPEKTGAQTVSTPITRHIVLYWAQGYTTYQWSYQGIPHTSVPYAYGYADWINSALGQGAASCDQLTNWASLFQTRLNNNCYSGCNSHAGADCSGYVMRVWGRPVGEAKWGTGDIADPAHSALVPCRASDSQCIQQAVRDEDLPRRMRMGDVFDDVGNHVVLLYYFDLLTAPVGPRFYEENIENPPCAARLNVGGWAWLGTHGGWWDGANGYRPYRYNEIRDDIYLPDLRHAWSNWESTLYVRNNNATSAFHVVQHAIYGSAGGDGNAINSQTLVRTAANDLWSVATSSLDPGTYQGGGVVAADSGTGAVVYAEGSNQAMAYTGIYPFSDLGLKTATTLYLPVFFYNAGSTLLNSQIIVQNAGKVSTDVTATYYGDDGRMCLKTYGGIAPWGTRVLNVTDCTNWIYPGEETVSSAPPSTGDVWLSASQPLAAIADQRNDGGVARRDAYNAFSQGTTTLYAPLLMRNFSGWNTTLHVQNLSNSTASVNVKYYSRDGGSEVCSDSLTIPPYQHRSIDHGASTCMSGFTWTMFAARISASQPITAIVNQDNPAAGDFQSYSTFKAGKTDLVLPFLRRDDAGYWSHSIRIQNTTGYDNVNVSVYFYDEAGGQVGSTTCTLARYGACIKYNASPDLFTGSVRIHADRAVVAAANLLHDTAGTSGDGGSSYAALEKKTSTLLIEGQE